MRVITRKQAVFTLNFVAGWVDAVGFLALVGSVQAFPSFMSGNSTKVVTDLVSGKLALAGLVAGVAVTARSTWLAIAGNRVVNRMRRRLCHFY